MKSSKYWEERVANCTWKTYNSLEEKNRALLEMYQESTLNISEELYKVTEKINSGKAVTLSDMHKYNRLTGLQGNMEGIIKDLGENFETFGKNNMVGGFKDTYSNIMGELGKIDFDMVPKKVMEEMLLKPWSGSDFSTRLWKNTQVLSSNLNEILVTGLTQGKPIAEISIQLSNMMNTGFNISHRLIRTETMHYLNESAKRAYKDGGCKEVQLWAAVDERTCLVCGVKHGNKYSLKDAPILPLHANCRCTYIPVLAGLDNDKNDIISDKIEFKDAIDIKEAEEFVRDVLGISSVSYKGCDLATANAWNKGLFDSFNRFPELKNSFGFVGECHERNKELKPIVRQYYLDELIRRNSLVAKMNMSVLEDHADKNTKTFMRRMTVSKNTFAESWSPVKKPFSDFRGITVNKDWGKDSNAFVSALKSNVESKFHPEYCDTIRSVLDHEIGHQLDDILGIGKISEVQRLFDDRTRNEITEDISKYSWNNNNPNRYSEMIAEAWGEYCNNPNPREISKTIGKIIESKYKAKFEL